MDPNQPISDEQKRQDAHDEFRAQGAQYDSMVRDLAAMGDAPGHAAKTCKTAAGWLRTLRPNFEPSAN